MLMTGFLSRFGPAILCLWAYGLYTQAANTEGDIHWTALNDVEEPLPPRTEHYKGKPAIVLDGEAHYLYQADQSWSGDFRLELDIAGDVLSGVGFHGGDLHNYQFIYFRPQEGGLQTAVQYVPVYNGALSWVLYNTPDYEVAADISANTWFHLTLEVVGEQASVYVNESSQPVAKFTLLPLAKNGGRLLLRSLFGESRFANIKVTPFSGGSSQQHAAATVAAKSQSAWQLAYPQSAEFPLSYDQAGAAIFNRQSDPAEPVVNLARYQEEPDGLAVARRNLSLDADTQYRMSFDFAGKLQVFVNRQELFRYSKYKLERIEGEAQQLLVPLKKGNNEILLVSEGDAFFFGRPYRSLGRLQHQNWGFEMHLEALD